MPVSVPVLRPLLKHNPTGGTVKSYVDIVSGERAQVKRQPGHLQRLIVGAHQAVGIVNRRDIAL
jgi:hypothetical protein